MTVELGYNLYGAPLFKRKGGAQGDFTANTPQRGLAQVRHFGLECGMPMATTEMGRMIRKSASRRTLLALEYDKNSNRVRQTDP